MRRWCRTYFLRRGRAVDLISDADAVVQDADGDDAHSHHHLNDSSSGNNQYSAEDSAVLNRLEAFYVKLWMTLRSVVRTAFSSHTDVLEAGTYIQVLMNPRTSCIFQLKFSLLTATHGPTDDTPRTPRR